MNHHAIIDGRIRCDHDRVAANLVTVLGRDVRLIAALNFVSVCAGENLAAVALDCRRQASQIFEWMELALSRKMQTRAGVETLQGSTFQTPYASQPGAMGGREFIIQNLHSSVRRQK